MKSLFFMLNTTACNNSCAHCYVPQQRKKRFKTLNEIIAIFDILSHLRKAPLQVENITIYFHDEPTLHPDILKILDLVQQYNFSYVRGLMTNGSGISRRPNGTAIATSFYNLGATTACMSFFGNESQHDIFSGRNGAYNDLMTAITICKNIGFNIHINLFITPQNLMTFSTTEKLLRQMSDSFNVSVYAHTSRTDQNPAILLRQHHRSYLEALDYDNKNPILQLNTQAEWYTMISANESMMPYLGISEQDLSNENTDFIEFDNMIYDNTNIYTPDFIHSRLYDSDFSQKIAGNHTSKGTCAYTALLKDFSQKGLDFIKAHCDMKDDSLWTFWNLIDRYFFHKTKG